MARGGTSSTSRGGPSAGSSSAKVKSEKIREETRNKGKQRRCVEDEDKDEDEDEERTPNANGRHDGEDPDTQGETDEEEEQGEGSPRGAKRSRVNEDGDARPADKGKHIERVKTLPRDVDG